MHNTIDITLDFEFGILHDKHMSVDIIYADAVFPATPKFPSVKVTKVKMPTQLQIIFSGKTNRDTIVDSDGKILSDMYVKVVGLKLDNLKVPSWVIEKKFSYVTTAGNTINSAYIGFNGIMTLDMPESNIFYLYRRLNKDV